MQNLHEKLIKLEKKNCHFKEKDTADYCMRKVEEKESKGNWHLITNRSSQTKQRFVSMWPQIWSNSVEISIDCQNAAPLMASRQHSQHSHSHSRGHETIFILLILAIGLSVASIVGAIFDLKSRNFGVLNDDFNIFDIDFKLALKLCEWDIFNIDFNDYDVSSSINDTTHTSGTGYTPLFDLSLTANKHF